MSVSDINPSESSGRSNIFLAGDKLRYKYCQFKFYLYSNVIGYILFTGKEQYRLLGIRLPFDISNNTSTSNSTDWHIRYNDDMQWSVNNTDSYRRFKWIRCNLSVVCRWLWIREYKRFGVICYSVTYINNDILC